MQSPTPVIDTDLREVFTHWRQQPVNQFIARHRRLRADQLRELLAQSEQMDLPTFNREVWQLGEVTIVRPDGTRSTIKNIDDPPASEIAQITQPLETIRIESRGNGVWRPASGIYSPQSKDDRVRLQNLRSALDILNNRALSPLEKAKRIVAVPGFGESTATGLVMMFHPDCFALRNKQSTEAFARLGISADSLETFEEAADRLRNALGAEDFLELDWFLYQLANDRVEVPELVVEPEDPAVKVVREAVERMYPDPDIRRTCLTVLADSIERANAVSPASWATRFRHTQKALRLNVSWTQVCVLSSGDLYLVLDADALAASTLEHIAAQATEGHRSGAAYPSLPFAYGAHLPAERLNELLPLVEGVHQSLVTRSAQQVRTRTNFHHAHMPEVIDYLRRELGRHLPQPDYGPTSPPAQQAWLFQANPDIWDLTADLEHRQVGDEEHWLVSKFRDEMEPRQPVVLWQAGENAGIYAIGELTDVPFERATEAFRSDLGQQAEMEWSVPFEYTHILAQPVLKSELLTHPILKDLSVIRFPPGTNFKVTPEQWDALQEFVGPARWWIEKTQVQGWDYRMRGDLAVGRALVAPIRAAGGADLYRNLRQIQPNDFILHFTNQKDFTGRSRASGSSYEIDTQPGLGIETDRTLVVPLRDYLPLDPPLSRQVLFAPPYAARLTRLLDDEGKNPFYRADPDLKLRSQAYVTPASANLVAILQEAYCAVGGGNLIQEDWDRTKRPRPCPDRDASTLGDLAAATHLDRAELMELEALLVDKRQLVLEGPPGSGKTYLAEHFARYFAGLPLNGVHDERVETVQFHQSYGYEDFVQGIRPVTDEHGQLQYHVLPGIFMRMCDLAARNPEQRFVLIIDEINRGNLSRIFGELLLLLEYRDKRVRLPYGAVDGKDDQSYLSILHNLYLIGTMNSTDRSLALLDYALRRRFYFYRLLPVVDGRAPVLDRWLTARGVSEQARQRVVRLFVKLNREVERHLGSEFQVGHSYFMRDDIGSDAGVDRLWRRAIMPLLEEYLHGARDREMVLAELTWQRLLSESALDAPAAAVTADEK